MIDWNTATTEDVLLIGRIGRRAVREIGSYLNYLEISMDLEACHTSGCPLDLEKLLLSEPRDFAHDILGIAHHIDRNTGKLADCFDPRCAKQEPATE